MKNTIYLHFKNMLISEAKDLKKNNPKDKAYIRYNLNNSLDDYIRTLNNYHVLKDKITQKRADMYSNWLNSLVCDLHP
jgi:hypothetical protein